MLVAVVACGLAAGNPPLPEPAQGEGFSNKLKVSGTGIVDIGNTVVDRRMGLEYYSFMYGEGHFEMDSTNAVSNRASSLQGTVNGTSAPLNLYNTVKMSYSGTKPLVGMKYIHSNSFYGGIGAEFQEAFEVTEMEKVQTTYFASTDPGTQIKDSQKAAELRRSSPAHLVGIDIKNSFNGTWQTDARWHKMFYKDIKEHQMFSGEFDVENVLRFHENPASEQFFGL